MWIRNGTLRLDRRMNMTDIRIDRPGTKTQTQTKKYYKSKYCFSLHLPKELEEKVKDAAESRHVTLHLIFQVF